jgi:hypothetical protein
LSTKTLKTKADIWLLSTEGCQNSLSPRPAGCFMHITILPGDLVVCSG